MSLEAQLQAATRLCRAGDQDACRTAETIRMVMQQDPSTKFNTVQQGMHAVGKAFGGQDYLGQERASQEGLVAELLKRQQAGYAAGGAVHTCPYCGK